MRACEIPKRWFQKWSTWKSRVVTLDRPPLSCRPVQVVAAQASNNLLPRRPRTSWCRGAGRAVARCCLNTVSSRHAPRGGEKGGVGRGMPGCQSAWRHKFGKTFRTTSAPEFGPPTTRSTPSWQLALGGLPRSGGGRRPGRATMAALQAAVLHLPSLCFALPFDINPPDNASSRSSSRAASSNLAYRGALCPPPPPPPEPTTTMEQPIRSSCASSPHRVMLLAFLHGP